MDKNWSIKVEDMKELFHWDEPEGCFATDRIMIDGEKVGYMYREYPDFEGDSGWRFICGDEDEKYMNDTNNLGIYTLNSVANNDREIIPFLNSPIGSGFCRDKNGNFVKDNFNVIIRQEIDKVLYELKIENEEDYKNKTPEELTMINKKLKFIEKKYEISENEVREILENFWK